MRLNFMPDRSDETCVSSVSPLSGVPRDATPGQVASRDQIAELIAAAFRVQSVDRRQILCLQWRVDPISLMGRLVPTWTRHGFDRQDAVAGVIAGMFRVCGAPLDGSY